MSNFNIQWLKENLQPNATIFYIGAAGLGETINFRNNFSDATIYAFECSNYWIEKHPIFDMAKQHKINYHQLAVSDVDGEVSFYQSEKNNDETWPVSSSIFEPTENIKFLSFSTPIIVNSTRLDTFCKKHNVHPDFIHIDAQGAEFSIFSAIGEYKPKFIWTEISEFHNYKTGITYKNFYDLMISLGYRKLIKDGPDELYVLKECEVTGYVSNSVVSSFIKTLEEKINTVYFVYNTDNKNVYENGGNIHSNTYLHNQLKSVGANTCVYTTDKLPNKSFIYEYQQPHFIETTDFFGDNGFNELDPIPDNVIDRIREKTAFLVITMMHESPLQPYRLEKIHKYFKKLNLPPTHIFYVNACLNGQEIYEEYCNSINESPACVMKYNMLENLIVHSHIAKTTSINYNKKIKNKTFLMFNRRWLHHPHRTLFLYNLYKRDIINDCFISFSKLDVDHNKYNYVDTLKSHYGIYFNETDEIDTDITQRIDNDLPLFLDTNDLTTSSLMFERFDDTVKYYDDSFISIISETYFYTNTANIQHLTEKTFKPLLYKHPFIMLGPPGMLKKLKEFGFKTFHEVWDESYDDTLDHAERFYKIVNLCEKISKWPNIKKRLSMEKCESIVNHNFNVLLNYNKDKKMIKEFLSNFF